MKFKENLEGVNIIKKSSDGVIFDAKTLDTLEVLAKTREDFWNVDEGSANFLNMLIKMRGAKNALEIGTSNGYSTIWLAKALKETGGKLTTIEFWDNRLELARANLKKTGVDDIVKTVSGQAGAVLEDMLEKFEQTRTEKTRAVQTYIKGGAAESAAAEGFEQFDFIFIDANKAEYIQYFKLFHPLLKKGGVVAADNILSHYKKTETYIKAITTNPDYQSQLIPIDTGILLSYKIK